MFFLTKPDMKCSAPVKLSLSLSECGQSEEDPLKGEDTAKHLLRRDYAKRFSAKYLKSDWFSDAITAKTVSGWLLVVLFCQNWIATQLLKYAPPVSTSIHQFSFGILVIDHWDALAPLEPHVSTPTALLAFHPNPHCLCNVWDVKRFTFERWCCHIHPYDLIIIMPWS